MPYSLRQMSLPDDSKTGRNKKKKKIKRMLNITKHLLTELEKSTPAVQITDSVKDSVWTPEFDMKHLKKAEGYIVWNIVSITIKMRSIVRIL